MGREHSLFSEGKVPKPNRAAIQRSRFQPLGLPCCEHIGPFLHREVRKSFYWSVMRVWGQKGGIVAVKCNPPLRSVVQLSLHAGIIHTHTHTVHVYVYLCMHVILCECVCPTYIHTHTTTVLFSLSALSSHTAWAKCMSRSPLRESGIRDWLQVAALRAKEIEYWH